MIGHRPVVSKVEEKVKLYCVMGPESDQSDIINENNIASIPCSPTNKKSNDVIEVKTKKKQRKEKKRKVWHTTQTPPLTPQSFLGGDKVFQRQGTKHNFKDVSEGKDGKVLLILCNPIGL